MGEFTFSYPTWFILFCVLAALVLAVVLYYRDSTFKAAHPRLAFGLGILRFLSVFGICFLLLGPLLKSVTTQIQKPIVVLAQDVSESVGSFLNQQGASDSLAYAQQWANLEQELAKEYTVETYNFGSEVSTGSTLSFTEKSTNLSNLLKTLYDDFDNQNLGAVLIASDGIFNEGSNPVYLPQKLTAPIYTVGLGDTTVRKDIFIKRTFNNEIAYLGDKFSVQVDVAAKNFSGSTANLTIRKKGGQTLGSKTININRGDFFTTEEFILDADQAGVQRYEIAISSLPNEVSKANNRKEVFIEVLDARQQILLLAAYPHPDLAAFRQSLSTNKNYELTTGVVGTWNGKLESYDFVLLHGLPTTERPATAIINRLNERNIPHLFVVSAETNLPAFNKAQGLLTISGDGKNTNTVQATLAPTFTYFTLSDPLKGQLSNYPPLIAPFGNFAVTGTSQILANQRIGKIDTEYPLLVLGESDGTKKGVLAGEGIWKWRLFDFLQNENHELTNELIGKTIQYLTVKQDKRQFRIGQPKKVFKENEPVLFDAQLYNDSYEQINDADVSLQIKNADDKAYDFVFDKTTSAYTLNAGILPVGDYRYSGSVSINGKSEKVNGQFSIQSVQLESYVLEADHQVLKGLSEKYGGSLLSTAQLASFPQLLADRGSVKPVIYESSKTQSIINLRWIFAILAFLLALEWFLRRYFGGY